MRELEWQYQLRQNNGEILKLRVFRRRLKILTSYFPDLNWSLEGYFYIYDGFIYCLQIILSKNDKGDRKVMLNEDRSPIWEMILNFEGNLKHSPIFYGWYSNCSQFGQYKVSTVYFMVGIGVYIYSFIAMLRKYAQYRNTISGWCEKTTR